ncbi:hypothetical protein [Thalassobacillus sp. CUG 92003]|uniref:hypothetical protein n=1 Tax=Thalassobacillus sp. CUG 92003 TaxID=2736641 RepID=UPI0015E6FBC8|nr:hypothetical protein [Thalassobacillus sp. CUG 92003]
MEYLIDTTTQVVHRSSYVGDVCDFHTTPLTQRESSQDENYVNRLVKETSYTKIQTLLSIGRYAESDVCLEGRRL